VRRWLRGWWPSFWRFRRTIRMTVVSDHGNEAQLWRLEVRRDRSHIEGPVADPRMDLAPDADFLAAIESAFTWAWAHEMFPRRARRGWVIRWCLFEPDGRPATGPVTGGSLGAAFGVAIAHLFGLGRHARRRLDLDVVLTARLDDDGTLLAVQGLTTKVPAAGRHRARLVVAQSDVDTARNARVGERPRIEGASRIVDALRLTKAPRHWSLPAALIAIILLAVTLVWTYRQHDADVKAARQQQVQQLATRSHQHLASDPTRAILSAAAAVSMAPDDTVARSALLASTNVDSRLQHVFGGGATSVTMSPDGKMLATGGTGGTVTLWEADQPKSPLRTERSGGGTVTTLAFSPDGRRLISADQRGTVVRWDTGGDQLRSTVLSEGGAGGHGVAALAVSPDGRRVAVGTKVKTVHVIHLDAPGEPVEVSVRNPVTALAFSSPTTLLIGSVDQGLTDQLLAVDVRTPASTRPILSVKTRTTITQHGVSALAVSADGTTVVSGSMGGGVILWNAGDLTQRKSFGVKDSVLSLAVDRTGANAVVTTVPGLGIGTFDRSVGGAHVQLWDLGGGTAVSAQLAGDFLTATTTADANLGTVAVRDLDGSTTTWTDMPGTALRQKGIVADIVPDPRSANSVITAGLGGRIDFVDAATGRVTRSVDATGHGSVMALTAHGSLLATAHSDGTVMIRDRDTGGPVGEPLTGHKGPVFRLVFSPAGDTLASGGEDGTVRLWDVATHKEKKSWTAGGNVVLQVAFDPVGRRVYVADSILQAFSIRGRLWWASTDSDQVNGIQENDEPARAILPLSGRVLIGYGDGVLRWLDTDMRPLPDQISFRHKSNVMAIAESRDQRFVVTAGADGLGVVLSAPAITPMLQLPQLDVTGNALYASAITDDQRFAVFGSEQGRIQIVDLDTGGLHARACRIVGRAATADDLGVTAEEVGLPCR
jgi:WD40 repeat protein